MMRVLFIGSIVGELGKQVVARELHKIKANEKIDFVLANGEDAGKKCNGIKPTDVDELIGMGINCITSGDDVWAEKEIMKLLESNPSTLLRPLNYPPGVPGLGSSIYDLSALSRPRVTTTSHAPEFKLAVLNLLGRSWLANIDCPFRVGIAEIERIRAQTKIIIVDFHAQTTAEKQAFAWWVDGKVSAVIGTHTKVQTADDRILPQGTAYITDAGMTGVQDGVLGMKKEQYIEYFLKCIPIEFEPAQAEVENKNACSLQGVILEIDESTGKTTRIQRIQVKILY